MPNLKPVVSLQDLTSLHLAKIIDSVCKNPELRKSELLYCIEYLQKLPNSLQSRICFQTIELLKQTRYMISERHNYTFVNLQTYELYVHGFDYNLKFFDELKANNLKRLCLKEPDCNYPEKFMSKHNRCLYFRPILNFIKTLSNLTEFKTFGICDDYMLEVFSQCCPLLEEIEIIDCKFITNEGICKLCGFSSSLEAKNALYKKDVTPSDKGCRNLKKIVIRSTILSSSIAAAALLKTCPNLTILSAAQHELDTINGFWNLLGNNLSKSLDSVSQRFALTTLEISCENDTKIFPLIVHTCPNITDITIWCSENETKDTFIFNHLQNLSIKKLKVKSCNPSSLMGYLKQNGSQIELLSIESKQLYLHGYNTPIAPTNRSHLQMIIAYCPNLSNFILKTFGSFVNCPRTPYSAFRREPKQFTSLKEITIYNGILENDDIKILFGGNKLLEKIDIDIMTSSSNFLDCLLTDGSIKELKSFYLHRYNLTMEHLRRLLAECPKLEAVGPLHRWEISTDEKLKLIEDIKKNNWNLNIEHNFWNIYGKKAYVSDDELSLEDEYDEYPFF